MSELSKWLNANGLDTLLEVLEKQQIDLDILPDLTESDLKDLGITLGPRRRLLKAIQTIGVAAQPITPPRLETAIDSAERRQLSVLFVDLVGSTALSARRDPEEMRQIVRRYQNTVAGEITRFEGYVAKFMGDGVLAYFGWPKAHEDEPGSAVRAAMAAVAAVQDLRTNDGEALAARAGIATGLVVVGDLIGEGAAQEAAVVGDSPNIAARLQELAQPGQVVIAESTQRLVQASFDLSPLGPRSVKGLAEPIPAFAVLGEKASGSRFEARSGGHLRPMVGRDQELALLLERWLQAQGGEGQCLLLVGEAGIGKSRIVRALLDAVAHADHTNVRYQCSPYHVDSAMWPIVQQLTVAARLSADDPPATKLDKIESLLRHTAPPGGESAPLIASLLGVPHEERYGARELAPQVRRSRTLATLVDLMKSLAAHRPVLVILEDVHWIDPSTLEFVHLMLDTIEDRRVLVLLTSRPDGQPNLAGHPHVTRLVLNRLGRAAVEAITSTIEGSEALPESVRKEIVARTDGVPLFVEELTRALIELTNQSDRGTGDRDRSDPQLDVPATLHDSLMSRLDRIPEVKRVAQVAACIGRNFGYQTLASIADVEDADLQRALDRLVGSELLFQRGTAPDASYTFKHALVRDAAANSLLRSEFRKVNGAIAASFAATEQPPPAEVIAWHAELAGLDRMSVDYLLLAGRNANARYANQEAINHLERALRLVAGLPETPERTALELRALTMIGVPRIALHGYSSSEVEANYRRIVELAERAGDKEQLFQGLRGLWNCIYDRADLENAKLIADRLCDLAVDHPAPEARGLAYRALGGACLSLGRLAEAIAAFESCAASCKGLAMDAGIRDHGESPFVIGSVYAAFAHTVAGNFDRAQKFMDEALESARAIGHPLTLSFALHIAANSYHFRNEPAECSRFSTESLRVADEHRLIFWLAASDILGGWVSVKRDGDSTGIERIRRGLHTWQTNRAELHIPTWYGTLAEGLLHFGALDEAEEAVDIALGLAESRKELFAVALLMRLKGVIASGQDKFPESREHFSGAIELARRQGAHLFELRGATDFARVLMRHADCTTARQVLERSLASIVEGTSAPCVLEAQAIMKSLQ
jgi:class 3 adenylate cyclase/tetratricopeptide (TPR) repeat protein